MDTNARGVRDRGAGEGLRSTSLRSQATGLLRARIISGRLRPGELYAIGSIAEELNVSATPIREALLDLASEGLIQMERNRGFRVRKVTDEDLDEIVALRTMIEVPAIWEISHKGLLVESDDYDALCDEIQRCADAGDWVGYLEADREFHLAILARLGNKRLIDIISSLRDQSRLYGLDRIAGTTELKESNNEHHQLLAAIRAGDADGAAELTRRHLNHARGLWAGKAETSL